MLRTIVFAFLASVFAQAALAATIEASSSPTYCFGECTNVPNSAGDTINWETPSRYFWVTQEVAVTINGDVYAGTVPAYTVNYSGLILADSSGNTITVSATWAVARKCGGGRAGGCANVYELVSGTIED